MSDLLNLPQFAHCHSRGAPVWPRTSKSIFCVRYASRLSMTPLLYLIVIVLTIFTSFSVCIYCIVKIVQVSNGFSLLDPEASSGLRIRKWFLFSIATANCCRCLGSLTEFLAFSITVVRDDRTTSSISFYEKDSLQAPLPYVIFLCRMLPTTLCFFYYALLALYVSHLYHSMWGMEFYRVRTGWVLCNAVVALATLQYLFAFPNPFAVQVLFLTTALVYACWLAGHAVAISSFYGGTGSSANSSGGGGVGVYSVGGTSLVPSGMGLKRVVARLLALLGVCLGSLGAMALALCLDLSGALLLRSFYCRSSVDMAAVLLGEVGGAWLLVALISNHLAGVEGCWPQKQSRKPTPTGAPGAVSATRAAAPLLGPREGALTFPPQPPRYSYHSVDTSEV
ncbi:hypothetical protein B484DRAFT_456113 [Ochromonadaceae sp. CCMP2298]|nr:hypothetical protein B484DRAFT_456113 [Ochromonadaceae sp. CCMP2298]